jgi:glycosyltransferase involved in cell wall biosynthesis
MRVLILAQGPEQVASSRTRVFAYLPHLQRAAVKYDLLVWNSDRFIRCTLKGAVPLVEHVRNHVRHVAIVARILARRRRYSTFFIQKVILPRWVLSILKLGKRRLVFDYDDALYALGPAQDRGPRAWVRRSRIRSFFGMLSASDVVLLENDPNRTLTEHYCRDIVTITGPIDTMRYQPRPRSAGSEVVLGWVGSPSTTGYLEMLKPVLQELVQRGRAIRLHLVGARRFETPGVTITQTPWALETEVDALATFDIGLMPLTDDPWSRGKGGYKILQYMAMGIPTVASSVGINAQLVQDGVTGFLADAPGAWLCALDRLIGDPTLRSRMGNAARVAALNRHSLEYHAPSLMRALVSASPAKETSV